MIEHNLKDMLSYIDIPATWVGLREVKESTTYRNVRDMKPQGNTTENSHGIMVEVLVDGQFGYYGTRKFGPEDIRFAAEKAYEQAKLSAPFAIHQFNPDARPVVQGQYDSPFIESAKRVVECAKDVSLSDIKTIDTVQREMEFGTRGTRPQTRGVGHSGYLTFARKYA